MKLVLIVFSRVGVAGSWGGALPGRGVAVSQLGPGDGQEPRPAPVRPFLLIARDEPLITVVVSRILQDKIMEMLRGKNNVIRSCMLGTFCPEGYL